MTNKNKPIIILLWTCPKCKFENLAQDTGQNKPERCDICDFETDTLHVINDYRVRDNNNWLDGGEK